MESSLRAFMLLMFMLAAGMAGVSVSSQPAAWPADRRASDNRRGTVALNVTSQPEQHFVFGSSLRHAAGGMLPSSTLAVLPQRGPRPIRLQYVDVRRICDELEARQASINLRNFSEKQYLSPQNERVFRAEPSPVGNATDLVEARDRSACHWHALSYDLLRSWEIDPDESQVALLLSLCQPQAVFAQSPSRHLRHVSVRMRRGAIAVLGDWPAVHRWFVHLRVTWTQFCNWLHHRHLRQKSPVGPSTEAAAESAAVTLEEYDDLLEAITAGPSSKKDPQATAAIALGDRSSP